MYLLPHLIYFIDKTKAQFECQGFNQYFIDFGSLVEYQQAAYDTLIHGDIKYPFKDCSEISAHNSAMTCYDNVSYNAQT